MGKIWIIAVVLLALAGCGSDDTPTRLNTFTPLTSIVITSTVVSLPAGVSTQLIATGNFSGLFTRDITSEVTWSSAQPGVADFPSGFPPGRVKALVAGPAPATITATWAGIPASWAGIPVAIPGSFDLNVSAATLNTLAIAPLLPSLPLGLTQAFTAQGTFSDGITRDLTKDATWSSTDATVATISDDFASKGMAIALQKGTTNISAIFAGLTNLAARTLLTVTDPKLLSIAVTPLDPARLGLTTQAFTATGTYSAGAPRVITTEVTWTSSDMTVASVATANSINALKLGSSDITATLGPVSGKSKLTVTGGNLNTIDLILPQANNNVLIKDSVSRVTARGNFDNGTSRDITGAVTLTYNSPNVISVTPASGNLAWVQALDVTTTPAKIFTTYGTLPVKEISLTVTAPNLNVPGLAIPEQTLTLASGSSGRLSLAGTFSPASSQDLTFSAEWSVVSGTATVDHTGLDKGRVTGQGAGSSVIKARFGVQEATTTVTVDARTLQSLTISAFTNPAMIIAGTEKKFRVTANYGGGILQDVTADADWSIDNLNVAKLSDQLSDPGLIVAVDAGTTTLTAKFGGQEDIETLTVSQ